MGRFDEMLISAVLRRQCTTDDRHKSNSEIKMLHLQILFHVHRLVRPYMGLRELLPTSAPMFCCAFQKMKGIITDLLFLYL